MPGATQPGARTAGWKYQAGHGFRRGQPVYLQSQGKYALATTTTGFDGLVGEIRLQQFELVTGGELDGFVGLIPNTVYSLSATAGTIVAGTAYPVYKASAADTALLVSANSGTTGTDVVLPYTFSVPPLGGAVPIAGATGLLDAGWIPPDAGAAAAITASLTAHKADFRAHQSYYVRAPEGGGILDRDEGSLVFDVDTLTQVIDEAFI